ncbi:MAG TPA: hypothetical protein VMT59_14105 [Gaiellaceae bacterium]|nr:hypothetical protein [Gaiellaceae bacterium]
MKTFRTTIAAPAAVFAALALVAGTAVAGTAVKKLPFTANYSGNATTKITNSVAAISATGTGTGTYVGKSTISGLGSGDTSQQPCVPFTGTGVLKGTGTTLTFKVAPGSSSCGDESGENFAISGHALVLKGTGKLAKAKGTLKMTGTYTHSTGAFTLKLFGTLTG